MGRVADHRGAVRPLLGPALATAAALVVLIGLGVWQLQRLAWKEALLASIAHGEAARPVALSSLAAPPPLFSKVEAAGTLRDVGLYGIAVRTTPEGEREGAFRLGVLERPGAPAVLVNEGWVPDGLVPDPEPRRASVVGYVLPGQAPGLFTPPGDPAHRRFFSPDPEGIAAVLGLKQVAPFILVALGNAPPGTYPQPAQHLPQPPNNHLGYALTWFGLAAGVLGIFVTYAMQKARPE